MSNITLRPFTLLPLTISTILVRRQLLREGLDPRLAEQVNMMPEPLFHLASGGEASAGAVEVRVQQRKQSHEEEGQGSFEEGDGGEGVDEEALGSSAWSLLDCVVWANKVGRDGGGGRGGCRGP